MIENKQELFEMGLKEMYAIENNLVNVLQRMSDNSYNPKLKDAFQKHLNLTKVHIERLEKIFTMMNLNIDSIRPNSFQGLMQDAKDLENEVSEDLIDSANISAAIKTEHMEMAFYQSLINLAMELKIKNAIKELRSNMKDEEKALVQIQKIH